MQSSTVDKTQSANIPTWVREALASLEFSDGAVLVEMMRDAPKGLAVVEAPGRGRLVLKQFKDRRGEATHRFLDQLTHAGLAAPGRFRVSRGHAWLEHNHTLVTDEAPGADWGAWFEAEPEKLQATSVAVAQWVAALQQLTVRMEDRSHLRDLTRLRREAHALAADFPTKAQWLGWIIKGISEGLGTGDPALVPSHGDLHLDEVYITDGDPPVVTVVDLVLAGSRRASYDVGFALAMLLVSSRMRTGSFSAGATAARAFWREWSRSGRDAAAVPAQFALSLVMSQYLELIAYKKDRSELLPLWLSLAATSLTFGMEEALGLAESFD